MYKKYVDPTFSWKNFSQEEQLKVLAADRSNNELETAKLESWCKELSIPGPEHIKIAVEKMLAQMGQEGRAGA